MTAAEAAFGRTPLGADLKAGVDAISYNQQITFTKYVRRVLPADGYVFWVRGDLVTPPSPSVITVQGSFHYAIDRRQEEAETLSVNTAVFTSEKPINFLNDIAPDVLYIGEFQAIRFAFSALRSFYQQAELWHYVGDAVYADTQSQIIDSVDQLLQLALITSNSLPIWLGLNTFQPNWPFYPPLPLQFPLYPSFLSPPNIEPQWGTVHIGESDTSSLVSAPGFTSNRSQFQSAVDKVRVTLWGLSNDQAQDFLATVEQYSYDTDLIGIMNVPIVKDTKRTQREMSVIAQKKVIDFEVNYLQSRIANHSRKIISGAVVQFILADQPGNLGYAVNNIGPFISAATGAAT